MHSVRATARYSRAIHATAELLTKLRLDFAFVGSVARAAWLGVEVSDSSLDVIAIMSPEQKNNVAMMASNRGFRVDRDEIDASIELDLIPLNFVDAEGDVRVHVLVASNALYGRMVAARVSADAINVVAAEDLALLLSVAEDDASDRAREALMHLPEFNRHALNERLRSIGLGTLVVVE